MRGIIALLGATLLGAVLRDAFETIILPRRVSRRFRITRLFYRGTWLPWRATARRLPAKRREAFLSVYGPLSLLALLSLWAGGIVLAFGMLQWAAGSGVALLAIVIGYLPVIYQAFSRREGAIALLDARAGSPPTAGELLWRHRADDQRDALRELLREWERWAADVLESHLSYPVLAFFRSQHNNRSWLAALTTILDASALVIVGLEGWCMRQAELTFAMARHTVVDLAQVFSTPPAAPPQERLPADELARLRARLASGGLRLRDEQMVERLAELRGMYEPYVAALLPPWQRKVERPDNWQTSAWDHVPRPVREK